MVTFSDSFFMVRPVGLGQQPQILLLVITDRQRGKYLDLDVAAAGNTEVIGAKMRTMGEPRARPALP